MAEFPGAEQAGAAPARPNFLAGPRLLLRYGGDAHRVLALSALLSVLAVALDLVPVWLVWHLVALLIADAATTGAFLGHALIAATAIALSFGLKGYASGLSHIAAFQLIHALRLRIARHMARLPMGWFQGRRSGAARQLIVDDPERLETLVAHGVPEGVAALTTWAAVTVWLFAVDWRMALVSIVLTPLGFALVFRGMAHTAPLTGTYQRLSERLNGAVVEYIAGMPVIKTFNRTGQSLSEVVAAVRAYTEIETDMGRRFVATGALYQTLVAANICVILPVGLVLMQRGTLDLATLAFFVILGSNYSLPLLKLFALFQNMAQISMASTVIADVLRAEAQPDTGRRATLAGRDIVFDNVSFGYGPQDVLHGVSFTAREGAVTALVGPSGSGKSTLAGLIPRLHDVGAGRITLGGVDLRDIGLGQLMEEVAFVFQDTFLFSGTIAENLRFGKSDASAAELEAAARAAQAHDFISALPNGYDARLGEAGAALSGGERQRLAIARAILKDAPVIVLDEATAFADSDSEAAIQQALSALARGRTLVVVAHRLHTIRDADRIVVLAHGRVAETGHHDALLARGGLYTRLWRDHTAARDMPLRVIQKDAAQ